MSLIRLDLTSRHFKPCYLSSELAAHLFLFFSEVKQEQFHTYGIIECTSNPHMLNLGISSFPERQTGARADPLALPPANATATFTCVNIQKHVATVISIALFHCVTLHYT